jgi:hypothetical protein
MRLMRWSRYRFLAGANRYIQQESTFWRRSLWDKAGGYVDASRRMASDFDLWVRFFRHARLYSVDALIGGFRLHAASLGVQQVEECHRIHDEVIQAELSRERKYGSLRLLRGITKAVRPVPKVRGAWQVLTSNFVRLLYHLPAYDLPPIIDQNKESWTFRKGMRPTQDSSSGVRRAV